MSQQYYHFPSYYSQFLPLYWLMNPKLCLENFPYWIGEDGGSDWLRCELPLTDNGDPLIIGLLYEDLDGEDIRLIGLWLDSFGQFWALIEYLDDGMRLDIHARLIHRIKF